MDQTDQEMKNKKILVVEDEDDARMLFQTLLQSDGFLFVDGAANGEVALEMQKKEKYDLIILDIIMPVMDGLEVLRQIRDNPSIYGKPYILMLTNLTGDVAEEGIRKYRVDAFLVKVRVDPEQLLTTVKEILR
jgi:two-component system chemotaxis response regulator CheY